MAVPALITGQGPAAILASNRAKAIELAEKLTRDRMLPILKRAEKDLVERLTHAQGLKGPGSESFTAAKLQSVLTQVRAVLVDVKAGITSTALETGKQTAGLAAGSTIEYLRATQAKFKGIHQPLQLDEAALYDRATHGAESSLLHRLQYDEKKGPGILQRYGAQVVEHFEGTLQQRFLAQTPWDETRDRLIKASPFLQGAPAHWAERILRTEVMAAHGKSSEIAISQANAQLGDMVKILSCVFDSRTGADSIAVHGEIRRPEQMFATWFGSVMHPPDRPNDRAVVVPHRISWPIPESLTPRSDAEVLVRWRLEGRKGSPPARPLMTTVPLDQFGKVQPLKIVKQPTTILIGDTLGAQPPAPPPDLAALPPPVGQPWPLPPPEHVHASPIVLEPTPPPQIVAPEVPRADVIMAEKIGGQAGSNEGGLYKGADGVDRYVKFYDDPAQAQLEHLANVIYDDLGLGTVKSELFTATHPKTGDKVTAYASKIIEGEPLKTAGLTPTAAKTVMKGFAADVLTANWDAVGSGLDNILIPKGSAGHSAERIDKGGVFLFRAKAGRKTLGQMEGISEWEGFFNPDLNKDYARVAKEAGVSKAEDITGLAAQIKAIKKLRDLDGGGWDAYVKHNAPGLSPADHAQTVKMLNQKTDLLSEKLKTLVKARVKKAAKGAANERKFSELETKPLDRDRNEPAGFTSRSDFNFMEMRKLAAWEQAHPDQMLVMKDYTGSGYHSLLSTKRKTEKEFNESSYGSSYDKGLYKRRKEEYESLRAGFKDAASAVEKAHPLAPAHDLQLEAKFSDLYRGDHGITDAQIHEVLNSTHHTLPSVLSTSWRPSSALSFAHENGSKGQNAILWHYKMRPGQHEGRLAVNQKSSNYGEDEVLLDEGRKFRIVEVHRLQGRTKTLHVTLEEVESGHGTGESALYFGRGPRPKSVEATSAETKPKKPKKTARYFYTKNGVEQVGTWMHTDSLDEAKAQIATWNEDAKKYGPPATWGYVKKLGNW